ncbi:MAG: DNA repair protein RecO [Candidatus Omnitrophota bacterium]
MAIVKTEAFVLNKKDLRETSILATFLTRNFGKIKGELKGIRTTPKKFGSSLEIGSLNEIVFYQKRSLIHLIDQCDLKESFDFIKTNHKIMSLAFYLIELIDLIMPLEERNEAVFDLLNKSLIALSTKDALNSLHIFQIKLLKLSGFKPHIDSCLSCNNDIGQNCALFSLRLGGLLCQNCSTRDKNANPILGGTIASLKHIEKSDWPGSLRLKLMPAIHNELNKLLFSFFDFHLEKHPRSIKFLKYAE